MKHLFLFLLFIPFATHAQIISTIAGNGTSGFTGDGFPATTAGLDEPFVATYDGAGNLYIADGDNHAIRKINASGIITTIAGNGTGGSIGDGGPATAAMLNRPHAVVFDASGNLYISDFLNSKVRKIDPAGIITTFAGTGTAGHSGDGAPATAAELNEPIGLAVDAIGNLYICEYWSAVVRKVDTAGIISTIAGTGLVLGDGGPATDAYLNYPAGIAIDAAGNIYVADAADNRVRKITAGIITTIAGTGTGGALGDGGPATAAQLYNPTGLTFDGSGNLYITDANNFKVRQVSTSGMITTYAGIGSGGFSGDGGPATAATFSYPSGVVFDPWGNLVIVDDLNDRLRKISLPDNFPALAAGHSQTLTVCENSTAASINSMMAVNDLDTGQTETWSAEKTPAHGTLVAAYSATSTGSLVTPAGLSYTPATGYYGADSFKVKVYDGMASDTTTVYVTVNPCTTEAQTINNQNSLSVFPNPAHNELNISSTEKIKTIIISNLLGQTMYNQSVAGVQKMVVNIIDFPAGVYFVKVNGTEVRKFMKE